MTRNRLIIGAVLLVLLGAIAGCAVGLEQPKTVNTLTIQGRVIVDAYHYDEATGEYVHFYHHESSNLVVDLGEEWIETQLGSDSPTAVSAQWISLSSDATAPVPGWLVIPGEIDTAGGLDRALGTYSDQGNGAWNIAKTFNADATYTDVQLTGLQYGDIGTNNLLAANEFTTPVTLNNGDALTVTWELSVSGP